MSRVTQTDGLLVLSLCDRTGNILRPWAEAGHECIAVDLQHDGHREETVGDGKIHYVEADVHRYLPPRAEYRMAFAFPPCTNLAVSGARWFKDKGLSGLSDGARNVERCRDILRWTDAPWMLENPVSTLSTYWREPDHKIHPHHFDGYTDRDENYTKETWLWTGAGFTIPPKREGDGAPDDRIHKMPPSQNRGDRRAETPMGFARAVYAANTGEAGLDRYTEEQPA